MRSMMSGLCVVNSCCFCIDLRKGTLILGYFGMVVNLIMAIEIGIGIAAGGYLLAQDNEDYQAAGSWILGAAVLLLLILIINLAFTVMLIVGVYQNKRNAVRTVLVYEMVSIVFTVILFLMSLTISSSASFIIQNIAAIAVSIYFWVVIRSYWLQMCSDIKLPYPSTLIA